MYVNTPEYDYEQLCVEAAADLAILWQIDDSDPELREYLRYSAWVNICQASVFGEDVDMSLIHGFLPVEYEKAHGCSILYDVRNGDAIEKYDLLPTIYDNGKSVPFVGEYRDGWKEFDVAIKGYFDDFLEMVRLTGYVPLGTALKFMDEHGFTITRGEGE